LRPQRFDLAAQSNHENDRTYGSNFHGAYLGFLREFGSDDSCGERGTGRSGGAG
jgi:hypothetical protein